MKPKHYIHTEDDYSEIRKMIDDFEYFKSFIIENCGTIDFFNLSPKDFYEMLYIITLHNNRRVAIFTNRLERFLLFPLINTLQILPDFFQKMTLVFFKYLC